MAVECSEGVLRNFRYKGRTGTYRGELEDKKPHGRGAHTGEGKDAGFLYEGMWANGEYHGRGREVRGDKGWGSYEGEYDGGWLRRGVFRHEDGRRAFEGAFRGGDFFAGYCPQRGVVTDADGGAFDVDAIGVGGEDAAAWDDAFWAQRRGWTRREEVGAIRIVIERLAPIASPRDALNQRLTQSCNV
jgi:hypothetical protein